MRATCVSRLMLGATAALGLALCGGVARAGTLIETYQAPGVQDVTTGATPAVCQNTTSPSGGAGCVYGEETFDGANAVGGGFTDTMANGAIGLTFSGNYAIQGAGIYGGAGGTGNYIVTFDNPGFVVNLTTTNALPGVNYFGMWLSALDLGNSLSFYSGSTLLGTYLPQDLISALGTCNGGNPYCGNPNTQFGFNNQQYVFINFFDPSGYITSIHFDELNGDGGFESDNYTFAYLDPVTPFGTPVPEPAGLAVFGAGLVALAATRRRARV